MMIMVCIYQEKDGIKIIIVMKVKKKMIMMNTIMMMNFMANI